MNFKVAIRSKKIRKDGTVNVKIRVIFNNISRDVATEYYVLPKYFDSKTGKIKAGGKFTQEKADRANTKLQIKIGIIAEKASKITDLRFMDVSSLMSILRDKHREMDFYATIDNLGESKRNDGNHNYADSFLTTKKQVEKFTGTPILYFEIIDYLWLERF
jgi:hypothetical protein